MNSLNHPNCNTALHPADGDEANVDILYVQRCKDEDTGFGKVVSYWQPTQAELDALNRGHAVRLHVLGSTHPPLRLDVEGVQ